MQGIHIVFSICMLIFTNIHYANKEVVNRQTGQEMMRAKLWIQNCYLIFLNHLFLIELRGKKLGK